LSSRSSDANILCFSCQDDYYLTKDFTCKECSSNCENGCINENTCTPPYPEAIFVL
jgi:hypothetical protein